MDYALTKQIVIKTYEALIVMMMGKGQIGLSIAERHRPSKESFDYRSASVEQWVERLPMGSVGETARQVYGALHEVNRLNISWKERYRFLEQLRGPVSYVQQSLVKRYTGMSFPLPPKTQRIATLAQTLYLEMALGYKTAIEEMLGGSFLRRDKTALTELIHRAVRYLSHAILTSYQTYAPHPPNSWSELHKLFLYAEHNRLHQRQVKDNENLTLPKSTIVRAYKQLLLLALASPYRLRQGEAETIYNTLALWAGTAHIIPYNDPAASEALFVVRLDSDNAPDYQAFNHHDCSTGLCRLVDTRRLSQILHEQMLYQEQQHTRGTLDSELLLRLIRSWGVAPKRHFNRSERNTKLEVVVGTSMLHQALAHESGDEDLYSKRAIYQSKTVENASELASMDVWNLFNSSKIRRDFEEYDMQKKSQSNPAPTLTIQTWTIRNESAGGYRLTLDNGQNAKVQVGEIIGLRNPGSDSHWEVGAVRWIRQTVEDSLEIGVQILAPQAMPVLVNNEKAKDKSAESQYALLLPAIATIGQPASIVTPILLFSPGNQLRLQMHHRHINILLHEKMQDSGTFVQFRFTPEQAEVAPATAESDKTASLHGGFDTLWKDL